MNREKKAFISTSLNSLSGRRISLIFGGMEIFSFVVSHINLTKDNIIHKNYDYSPFRPPTLSDVASLLVEWNVFFFLHWTMKRKQKKLTKFFFCCRWCCFMILFRGKKKRTKIRPALLGWKWDKRKPVDKRSIVLESAIMNLKISVVMIITNNWKHSF